MAEQGNKAEFFDKREVVSREEREEYLNRKLQQQIQYAYDHAPAMRDKLDKAGVKPSDIRAIKDMERIPITTKDELIDLRRKNPPFGGLIAVPLEKLPRVYMSPGPIYDAHSLDERFAWRFQEAFFGMGFRKGDIATNTVSYHMVPAGNWVDEALRGMGITVIPMGTGNTDLQIQVMHDMRVTGWLGMTGFLMAILTKAEEKGYDIKRDFALRVALAGAEMGGEVIRDIFEEKYGIYARDLYATADVGLTAYECSQKGGMHLTEEAVVEIVDPETSKQLGPGEVGQIVVTPFDNTYPLIRFGTGDLSSYIDEPCPCGRTSLKLTKVMGRVGEAVRTRGMFIHPRQVAEALSKFPEVSRYQAVVTRPQFRDELVLKIELANENIDRERLTAALGKTFPDVCRLRIDRFEFVEKGIIPEDAKGIVDQRTY
jgi:phenylacetate-CoA ligase